MRSYLFQRAKLLRTYKKKLKKKKNLPKKIYEEFGLPISIPRREGFHDLLQIETWRLKSLSLRSSGDEIQEESSGSKIDSKLAACPEYNLSVSCQWVSDGFGSTVGVAPVKRMLKKVSTLTQWSRYRDDNKPPIIELERCIQLYNTVDLDVKHSWPLPYAIPRPQFAYYRISNNRKTKSSKKAKKEKLLLQPLEDNFIEPSFLFVRYSPRFCNGQPMDVGDFEKVTEKNLPVEKRAAGSDAHTSAMRWPAPPQNQEKLKSQVFSILTNHIQMMLQRNSD